MLPKEQLIFSEYIQKSTSWLKEVLERNIQNANL
jgi:hypothetical protein